MESYTQTALAMSAALVRVRSGWQSVPCTPVTFGSGAERRQLTEPVERVTAVGNASMHGEKSVRHSFERAQILARTTVQLNGYGFGTPVGVGAPRVDVATGLPPRSRPV